MKRSILLNLLAAATYAITAATPSFAAGPNHNVMFYGYDWLDGRNGINVDVALADLSSTGPTKTNLNVVRTISGLNSNACASKHCAVGVGAGSAPANSWLDICPDAKSNTECQGKNSWNNIWTIVANIKAAKNVPAAIYFIDEPSFNSALSGSDGKYINWQYASYVCTLRQALAANNLSVKIFTVLGINELGPDTALNNVTNEIRHQMPTAGCPSTVRSMPDWIGIDNYDWRHVLGAKDDSPVIHDIYNQYFPPGGAMPTWVLVPPATIDVASGDLDLHDRIQVYWDYLNGFPNDPVVAVMNWRFDERVMTVPAGVNPSDHNDPRNSYWRSRDLLKFMGNMLTP